MILRVAIQTQFHDKGVIMSTMPVQMYLAALMYRCKRTEVYIILVTFFSGVLSNYIYIYIRLCLFYDPVGMMNDAACTTEQHTLSGLSMAVSWSITSLYISIKMTVSVSRKRYSDHSGRPV